MKRQFNTSIFILMLMMLGVFLHAQQLDNLSETNNGNSPSVGHLNGVVLIARAQSFTTGSSAITNEAISITIAMANANGNDFGGSTDFTVSIYSDNSGVPNSSLFTLSGNNDPKTVGEYTYTGTVSLNASTTYHIVLTATTANPGYVARSTSATEFNEVGGFSVPTQIQQQFNGGAWTNPSFGYLKFSLTIPSLLPIELLSFSATPKDNTVVLEWETATEEYNDYMEIQRSTDGELFYTLGSVEGAGTSLVKQSYEFIDKTPHNGINYYRLRQVDFDGTETIHSITSAIIQKEEATPIIYPNPTTEHLFIATGNRIGQFVIIYNQLGEVVKQFILQENNYTITDLPIGIYFVKVDNLPVQKIVKQ